MWPERGERIPDGVELDQSKVDLSMTYGESRVCQRTHGLSYNDYVQKLFTTAGGPDHVGAGSTNCSRLRLREKRGQVLRDIAEIAEVSKTRTSQPFEQLPGISDVTPEKVPEMDHDVEDDGRFEKGDGGVFQTRQSTVRVSVSKKFSNYNIISAVSRKEYPRRFFLYST